MIDFSNDKTCELDFTKNASEFSLPLVSKQGIAGRIFFLLIFHLFFPENFALADVSIHGSAGAGVGIFQAEGQYSSRVYPAQLFVKYEFSYLKPVVFVVGLGAEYYTISYTTGDNQYVGSNILYGGSFGLDLIRTEKVIFRMEGMQFPISSFQVKNNYESTVNGSSYNFSTKRDFKSDYVRGFEFSVLREITEKPFDRYERGRIGLGLEYLNQRIKSVKNTIQASNRKISPTEYTNEKVNFRMDLVALRLIVGFSF